MSTNTIWGAAQESRQIARGIVWYSTAGHGGYAVSAGRAATMKPHLRACGEQRWGRFWFEEDCAWAAVVFQWPALFEEKEFHAAVSTLRNWFPDAWEAAYGRKLTAAESHTVNEREFKAATRENYVPSAAWGDWHETVPAGLVGVFGKRASDGSEVWKLVPAAEYRGEIVIDKFPEWSPHA